MLPLNLAPKPSKLPPWRLIHNCMALNDFVKLWSVRYEGLHTVHLVVPPGDWLFSVDATDAYYQLFLHGSSRRLLGASIRLTQQQILQLHEAGKLPKGFAWDRSAELVQIFVRPCGLPMGFRNMCAIWTKLSRVFTAKWRREGKKLVHLLDDVMFAVSGTFEQACSVRDDILSDFMRAGVLVNWKESVLVPCKCLRFLGMLVDSVAYRFFVSANKVEKLQALVCVVVDGNQPELSFRQLASILGKIMSMQIAVPTIKMLTEECYAVLRPGDDWEAQAPLTEAVLEELAEVVRKIVQFNTMGNPIADAWVWKSFAS